MDSTIPSALQAIFKRATDAGLMIEPYRDGSKREGNQKYTPVTGLLIHLPNGKDMRPFLIRDDERLHRYTNVKFEQMEFIHGLEAIWSKTDDVLEAELQGDEITYNPVFLIQRLKHIFRTGDNNALSDESSLFLPYRRNHVQVEFGESTTGFDLLGNRVGMRPNPVVRISGTGSNNHDEARSALYSLTDPLLFQIKREYNIHLRLRYARPLFSENRSWGFPNGIPILGS